MADLCEWLHAAILANDVDRVHTLCEWYVDILKLINTHQRLFLDKAIGTIGSIEICDAIMERGGCSGVSVCIDACRHGHLDLVKHLLSNRSVPYTLLMLREAYTGNHTELINYLNSSFGDYYELIALEGICAGGNFAAFKKFHDTYRLHPDYAYNACRYGFRSPNIEIMQFLLTYVMLDYDQNSLVSSACHGGLAHIQYLVPYIEYTQWNELFLYACDAGNMDIVHWVLARDPTVIHMRTQHAFNSACHSANLTVIKFIESQSRIPLNYEEGLVRLCKSIERTPQKAVALTYLVYKHEGNFQDICILHCAASIAASDVLRYIMDHTVRDAAIAYLKHIQLGYVPYTNAIIMIKHYTDQCVSNPEYYIYRMLDTHVPRPLCLPHSKKERELVRLMRTWNANRDALRVYIPTVLIDIVMGYIGHY
jgi:hypothetical protein